MAPQAHTITRRGVLAGALALSAIAALPAAASFDPSAWVDAYLANGGTLQIYRDAFGAGEVFVDNDLGSRLIDVLNEGDNRKRVAAYIRSHRPELVVDTWFFRRAA